MGTNRSAMVIEDNLKKALAELLVLAGAWVMFWLLAAHVEILTAFFGSVPDGWGVHGLRLLIKLSGPLCGGLGVLGRDGVPLHHGYGVAARHY